MTTDRTVKDSMIPAPLAPPLYLEEPPPPIVKLIDHLDETSRAIIWTAYHTGGLIEMIRALAVIHAGSGEVQWCPSSDTPNE